MRLAPARATRIVRRAGIALLLAGWVWIGVASLPYFVSGPLHPFVIEKLPLSAGSAWRAVLYVHVVSALFALPACTLLLSERLRLRALTAHRWLGRVTGMVVLLTLIPSGAVLATTATGGLPSTVGFLLSGAIMAYAMVRAVITARRHQLAAHRRWIGHVVGQMSVAVISRALLVGAGLLEVDPLTAYVASLWGPVLGVATWVEWRAGSFVVVPLPQPRGAVMSHARRLVLIVPLLAALTPPSLAATATATSVLAQLQRNLLTPLAAHEGQTSRFSRAPRPPQDRRVRLLGETAQVDATGAEFYVFTVDNRWSRDGVWDTDAIGGCIYPSTGQVFVHIGDGYQAASWLFGTQAPTPPAATCRAAR